MIPKEKAEELLRKMLSKNPSRQDGISMIDTIQAKLCALVAVEFARSNPLNSKGYNKYLDNVKQELEKL
jgi:hypothetical protein